LGPGIGGECIRRVLAAATERCSLHALTATPSSNIAKLPRSPSSPSPPAARRASGRAEASRRPPARRLGSGNVAVQQKPQQQQGWSTSYQAGSSGSETDTSTDDDSDDTDDGLPQSRGRPVVQHAISDTGKNVKGLAVQTARPGTPQQVTALSGPGSASQSNPAKLQRRPFTRSRSPAVNADQNGFSFANHMSMPGAGPSSLFSRQKIAQFEIRHLMPSFIHATFRPPFSSTSWKLTLDLRQTFENSLLICSLGYCATKMRGCVRERLPPDLWNARDKLSPEMWISIGDNRSTCAVVTT